MGCTSLWLPCLLQSFLFMQEVGRYQFLNDIKIEFLAVRLDSMFLLNTATTQDHGDEWVSLGTDQLCLLWTRLQFSRGRSSGEARFPRQSGPLPRIGVEDWECLDWGSQYPRNKTLLSVWRRSSQVETHVELQIQLTLSSRSRLG